MSPHAKHHIARGIVIGVATTLIGAFLLGAYSHASDAWTNALNAKADTGSVRSLGEKLDAIATKVDSANLRLTQIQCGEAVVRGCR